MNIASTLVLALLIEYLLSQVKSHHHSVLLHMIYVHTKEHYKIKQVDVLPPENQAPSYNIATVKNVQWHHKEVMWTKTHH